MENEMTQEVLVFNELSKTLKLIISQNLPNEEFDINYRVKIFEKSLIQEILMAQSVGKSPEYRDYKIPQISYEWQELHKSNS